MNLITACTQILQQIGQVLDQLSDRELTTPVNAFGGATIGQHYRHALEFFQCLMLGVPAGQVSYDHRSHSRDLEQSKLLLTDLIGKIGLFVDHANLNQPLTLAVSYDPQSDREITVATNLAREIVYNIEHVVHHMALVKIGIAEVCPHITIPEGFGVAVSTLKYHRHNPAG